MMLMLVRSFRYRDSPFGYEKCYFFSTYRQNYCDSDSSLITCGSETDCDSGVVWGTTHDYIDTSSAAKYSGDSAHSSYLVDCGTGSFADYWTDDSPDLVYVINKKRAPCVNSTHYTYQGYYGSGWVNYGGYQDCGAAGCNSSLDDVEKTNSGDTIPSPCNEGAQTDLEVLDMVVIQTVKDVTMIKGKSGIIRVRIRNNGNSTEQNVQQARVNLTAPALQVNSSSYQIKPIDAGETIEFDWRFKPIQTGTKINISVKVEILD